MARKRVFGVHEADAREIDKIVGNTKVNVTITSPPYFDLKDYDNENQIGFGQEYEEYLRDLKSVFQKVYDATSSDGSLWIIIDTFRKDGEEIPLPFDLAYHLRKIGWKLQEIIIWEKDKTVPWVHHGQMRNIFEYILVFSKEVEFKFELDRIRDFTNLKKWWIKYPERYNPKGKTPVAIWEYNIPTQGSWGGNYIRHFCPLPDNLIERILLLTTDEKDIVLDPFAGTGAVLSQADAMKRKFIGTELNGEYINKFNQYFEETKSAKRNSFSLRKRNNLRQDEFEYLILELRALKFGRMVINSLMEKYENQFLSIFVNSPIPFNSNGKKRMEVEYIILCTNLEVNPAKNHLKELTNRPPLSKFGIESKFKFVNLKIFAEILLRRADYYSYSRKITHKYVKKFNISDVAKGKMPTIISEICVSINESDY
ncbi:MAG: site-specific DNA-methyltransferase [Bacteroidota bacterium]